MTLLKKSCKRGGGGGGRKVGRLPTEAASVFCTFGQARVGTASSARAPLPQCHACRAPLATPAAHTAVPLQSPFPDRVCKGDVWS